MSRKLDLIAMATVVVAAISLLLYYANRSIDLTTGCIGEQQPPASGENATKGLSVLQVWEMPDELTEISANVLVDSTHMACVQDNDGVIYIYNLKSKSVDKKISFGGNGDYEGLSLVGTIFYVLRSDGFLYEVATGNAQKPIVKTYDLPLEIENYTEPMFYDHEHNRLLIGTKDKDLTENDRKGVYAFDLTTKKMNTHAVFMIGGQSISQENSDDKKSRRNGKKRKKRAKDDIMPSEIAIHPQTGSLYVLSGPKSELLIADRSGQIQSTIQLDKKIFPQPEGMCFTPSGGLYISSEGGKKGRGVIAKVQL
ncbi:MAG: SdiA-regulated domain-containing protein [Puia sp.]|nr:SdiA-regulated domain-containing protein [Puia sp.]